MKSSQRSCIFGALLLLAVAVSGDERSSITSFPEAMQADERLNARVSLSSRGQDIEDFLEALGKQLGVAFQVSRPLRDLRVTVMVREAPAHRLLAALAALFSTRSFPAKWQVEDAKKPIYLLWKNARSLQEASQIEQEARQLLFEKALEMLKLVEADDAAREKMLRENPLLSEALMKGNWENLKLALTILSAWGEDALRQAIQGPGVYYSVASLSPEVQEPCARIYPEIQRREQAWEVESQSLRPETDAEMMERLRRSQIGLRIYDDQAYYGLEIVLNMHSATGGSGESPMRVLSLPKMEVFPNPMKGSPAGKEMKDLEDKPVIPPGEALLVFKHLIDLQSWLAAKMSINIVSDYYMKPRGLSPFSIGTPLEVKPGTSLSGVLEEIEKAYRYSWNRMDDIYLFRNRFWLQEDATQMPERALKKWRRAQKRYGYLRLEDLSDMAQWDDSQLRTVEEEFPVAEKVIENRALLALYGSLNPQQKGAAQGMEGIPLAGLSPQQAAWLQSDPKAALKWSTVMNAWDQAALRMRQEKKAGSVRIWFGWLVEGRPWLEWPIEQ